MGMDRNTGVKDLFVEVDGVRLHYQRAGAGRPLLLIHGLVGSARNWRLNIDELARGATVYAIDLLNMGESERVHGLDASLEATADTLAQWMDAVGLAEADIAGHSHGGAIAMMFAARHPERVGKLILFAPANPFCELGHQLIAFYNSRPGQMLANLIPKLPTFLKTVALGRMYGDPKRATRESLEGYTDGLATPGSIGHVLQIVRRWHTDMAVLSSVLPRIVNTPALLIWGDRDRAVGLSSARKLQQVLRQSELVIVPGVGHIAFEEMPEVCNRTVRRWLASVSPVVLEPTHQSSVMHALELV
jgi:4,5:9,10-diseco-3-hydroxy-5,9,17-trioxoandrosta-1(10),2-diene-4-oate hydrolase